MNLPKIIGQLYVSEVQRFKVSEVQEYTSKIITENKVLLKVFPFFTKQHFKRVSRVYVNEITFYDRLHYDPKNDRQMRSVNNLRDSTAVNQLSTNTQ